ncbi:MAG TPA: hypothetical protein VMF61_15595 [Candidatus Acidoferrales bacterium]|nr:hypothetical protein [Candidatus Acidoferrales bacterium]
MFTTLSAAARRCIAVAFASALAAAPLAVYARGSTTAYTYNPTLRGRISSIPGKYTIEVRTRNGALHRVQLHQGTIINPTGITLQPGFPVTIYGQRQGDAFAANEIDTPYHYAPAPAGYYYPYGGPGTFGFGFGGFYPYGYYGVPFVNYYYVPTHIVGR